ncbi:uncharacterized protein LOC133876292 [Alnus glutinosa]|uniref:uncharacterized protein LOC133876292 n=1 Tax=Alnus glutinosa TaxID=3517 RepID=UPI002D76AF42|nr:uncharacterized protein LOC133876292 [Alnus glutinosa]
MLRCGCEFNLDFKCATLPPTVRCKPYSNSNEETFVLCFEFEDDYHDEYNCDICGKERLRNHWFYYSPYGGDLAAHLACILGKYSNIKFGRTYTFDMHEHALTFVDKSEEPHPPCDKCGDSCHAEIHHEHPLTLMRRSVSFTCDACGKEAKGISGVDGGSIDPLPYVVEKSKLGEDNIEIAVEIKHISHEHDLKLIDEQLENDEKCDGCRSNGFVYHCDKCNFDLDVQCSLRSDIMNHKGHDPHQLILSSTSNDEKCSSCDNDGIIFCCASSDDCKFTLDLRCVTLLAIIRYRSYEQLFTLCYKSEDDSDDEYYCDICEQPRNPKHWFYYCADLDFPAHPKCILGEYPNIKFGKTYKFDTHEHPLAFVDKSKGAHPRCNKCGDFCYGLSFECVKCNFSLHADSWCLRR